MARVVLDRDDHNECVDLWCGECDEQFGNGGNNVSMSAARKSAKAHAKATGHTRFSGSQMFWIEVA